MKTLPASKEQLRTKVLSGALVLTVASTSLLGVAPLLSSVHAQSVRTMTVVPPTVEVSLAPGEHTEGTMKLINDSPEALDFTAIMQDFIVDNDQGIPNILPPDTLSNKYSAAAWIGLNASGITIPSHTRQNLTYYIQVPPDAKPGGHYAVVVFNPKVPNTTRQYSGSTVNSQIGTLFYITVKGNMTEKAQVTKFDAKRLVENGPVTVNTTIKNLGDNHIRPRGYITVTNMLGKTSYTVPLDEHNIFPEAARSYVNSFGKKFMFGRYKATLLANYGQNNNLPLTASLVFWVFPWKIVLVLILIVIAAILAYLYWKKNRTGGKKKPEPTQPHDEAAQAPTQPQTTS